DGKSFIFTNTYDTIKVQKVGKTLRDAFVVASARHFKPTGIMPEKEFFTHPQYNTWIELVYNQNQADIERYADGILSSGLPAGILMVDDNWQRYYGNFDFKAERFSDAKGMVDRLHQKGFKVMLWVCPFVSADSPEFRFAAKKGYLIKAKGSAEPAIVHWWNGYSGLYDLTNPEAAAYLKGQLAATQQKYGVDGFKFDAGDLTFYTPKTQDYFDKTATAATHSQSWAKLGLEFPYNEYRACWAMQGYPLVQRLGDKDYSWGALGSLIPEMINAGMMGYPFTCPDMVGGGQFASFENIDPTKFDQNLIVRSAQVHALMPMMQFSVAPWRILDKEHMSYCLDAVNLRQKLTPYILELAAQAAKTGEPIVRPMEYVFPHKGFSDCKDQFMLGGRYLVAPVLTADGKRMVRLPKGRWVDDLGKSYRGPILLEINAPTGRLPYFEFKK
ncbi:MAG: glycoside hydrolase family 31 protein, partial [Mucinivorans sp.]